MIQKLLCLLGLHPWGSWHIYKHHPTSHKVRVRFCTLPHCQAKDVEFL